MVWNHRALELTVAAIQPGDHPEDWAGLTHQLRWAATHYDNALSWPWPLMVAKHLAEYLMPGQLLEEVLAGNDEQDKTDTNERPSSPSAGLHARTATKLTMNPDLTSQRGNLGPSRTTRSEAHEFTRAAIRCAKVPTPTGPACQS